MTETETGLYRGRDPREVPAYSLREAAHYAGLAPATLRSWVVGRMYPKREGVGHFKPLIRPSDEEQTLLSFSNLVEAHILRALRTEHGVSIKAVRDAFDFAEQTYQIKRVLLAPELRTEAGSLLLDKYGELVNLSRSGQLAMRKLLEAYLKRVDWDVHLPARLYPFVPGAPDSARLIVIDPALAFGRPVISGRGVSTRVIADRIDAGEAVEELAKDYLLDLREVEGAVLYERAA